MSMPNQKNLPLSAAAQSLGLGDNLKEQVQTEVEARKKKVLQMQNLGVNGAVGPATMTLYGGGAP